MLQQITSSKLDYINQSSPLFTDLCTNGKHLLKNYLLRYRSFHVGSRLKTQGTGQFSNLFRNLHEILCHHPNLCRNLGQNQMKGMLWWSCKFLLYCSQNSGDLTLETLRNNTYLNFLVHNMLCFDCFVLISVQQQTTTTYWHISGWF